MKDVKDYSDLVEYKKFLERKDKLAGSVMKRSLDNKKNEISNGLLKLAIPAALAVGGYLVTTVVSGILNPEDTPSESSRKNSKRKNTGIDYGQIVDIAKLAIPIVTAYVAKRNVEK